jgi:hypothetical protein
MSTYTVDAPFPEQFGYLGAQILIKVVFHPLSNSDIHQTQSAQSFIYSPQRHREHSPPAADSFTRSGDGDRVKKLSPSGITLLISLPYMFLLRGILFPGRRLPARKKTIFSVPSVSLW